MPNGLAWLGVTTIGYAIGMTLSTYLTSALARPISPVLGGILYVLLYGAVIGIGIGGVQFLAFPRGVVPLHASVPATVLGAAVGFAVASAAGEFLGNAIDPAGNIVIGGGIIQGTSGAIVGLAIAVAQWFSLRRVLPDGCGWIVATVAGSALGYAAAAAVLELIEVPLLKANLVPSFGAILGIFSGGAQGLVLWSRNRQLAVSN